jgi:hypothetical protein
MIITDMPAPMQIQFLSLLTIGRGKSAEALRHHWKRRETMRRVQDQKDNQEFFARVGHTSKAEVKPVRRFSV